VVDRLCDPGRGSPFALIERLREKVRVADGAITARLGRRGSRRAIASSTRIGSSGIAATGASGFLGAKLAYDYRVRVANEPVQADGLRR
jgi:hypothetical protein